MSLEMKLAVIMGAVAIGIAVAISLANGGRYERSKNQYKQRRVTGKGLMQDYDKQNRDIDKYSR